MGKMKWRPAPDELVRIFTEAVAAYLPGAQLRKMFGYPAAFFNGNMFAGLHQENMILRLSESDRARLLMHDESAPFEPMPGRIMKEYVTVPPSIYDDPVKLKQWLNNSYVYAQSLPPKKPKKA
ncbi:MAG: TfoX/Sxy family protein [Thermoleophilia bacterium]|jgi:TfoX/Sxy family transcriptional regulator of competence genes